jgi:hypothetical protein
MEDLGRVHLLLGSSSPAHGQDQDREKEPGDGDGDPKGYVLILQYSPGCGQACPAHL